jgi:hypothetical protein
MRHKGIAMDLFYVGSEHEALLCHRSLQSSKPITLTGVDRRGRWNVFTGRVLMLEDDPGRPPHRRWRAQMEDGAGRQLDSVNLGLTHAARSEAQRGLLIFNLAIGATIILGG